MKTLVTGSAGFIGSFIVDALEQQGYEVVGLDDLSTGHNEHKDRRRVDIRDYESIRPLFDGVEYVFHQAAMGRVPMCVDDPKRAYEVNVLGSVNVLEAARQAGVKKVVLASSCIVYSDVNTSYRSTKMAMEEAAQMYTDYYDLPTVSLRYANVYGPRQEVGKDSAMFAMLRDSYERDGFVRIFGDGKQTRDWVHVTDVARANLLAAESDYTGPLDIGTGRGISLNQIIKLLDVPAQYEDVRPGDAKHIKVDPKPAKKAIGFAPQVKFETGIKQLWV